MRIIFLILLISNFTFAETAAPLSTPSLEVWFLDPQYIKESVHYSKIPKGKSVISESPRIELTGHTEESKISGLKIDSSGITISKVFFRTSATDLHLSQKVLFDLSINKKNIAITIQNTRPLTISIPPRISLKIGAQKKLELNNPVWLKTYFSKQIETQIAALKPQYQGFSTQEQNLLTILLESSKKELVGKIQEQFNSIFFEDIFQKKILEALAQSIPANTLDLSEPNWVLERKEIGDKRLSWRLGVAHKKLSPNLYEELTQAAYNNPSGTLITVIPKESIQKALTNQLASYGKDRMELDLKGPESQMVLEWMGIKEPLGKAPLSFITTGKYTPQIRPWSLITQNSVHHFLDFSVFIEVPSEKGPLPLPLGIVFEINSVGGILLQKVFLLQGRTAKDIGKGEGSPGAIIAQKFKYALVQALINQELKNTPEQLKYYFPSLESLYFSGFAGNRNNNRSAGQSLIWREAAFLISRNPIE
jgi:hypothetical protein